uniref:RSE1/DDB1/CPSF1 first beta-propeller domain-containing protein n=1 Tax=Oncorhynchus tshawytscha TaxID=74940 RepID=A0AAZ3PTF6_ONCTS
MQRRMGGAPPNIVPGGSHGPSGVFICSENYITYKNFGNQPDIRCPIPRRRNDLYDSERHNLRLLSHPQDHVLFPGPNGAGGHLQGHPGDR